MIKNEKYPGDFNGLGVIFSYVGKGSLFINVNLAAFIAALYDLVGNCIGPIVNDSLFNLNLSNIIFNGCSLIVSSKLSSIVLNALGLGGLFIVAEKLAL